MAKKIEIELPDEAYKQLEDVLPVRDQHSVASFIVELLVCDHCRGIKSFCQCDNDE